MSYNELHPLRHSADVPPSSQCRLSRGLPASHDHGLMSSSELMLTSPFTLSSRSANPLHQNLEEGADSLSESVSHMIPPPATSLGNLSSLDITNDDELPTDPSNSSDTQEESESRCRNNTCLKFSLRGLAIGDTCNLKGQCTQD